MAFAYSANIQNRIAYNVWGIPNSTLSTDQKAMLDGTWTTGDPGGMVGDALTRIKQYAQWWEQAGATSAPQAWEHWLVSLASFKLAVGQRPERIGGLKADLDNAVRDALDSFSLDAATASTLAGQSIHVQGLRFYVMNHCIRRSPRLFVPPADIDSHTQWTLNYLWNLGGWNFRKRQVIMTIASNGGVTFNLTGSEAFDSLASRKLYYSDNPKCELQWATADQMSFRKAEDGTDTGRPAYMRMERSGSSVTWHLSPAPDQQYTLRGEVYVTGPGTPANATATTVFDRFPPEFGPVIRDMVLARVLDHHGAKDGQEKFSRAVEQASAFLPAAEDHGRPAHTQAIRDRYHDAYSQSGQNAVGGVM